MWFCITKDENLVPLATWYCTTTSSEYGQDAEGKATCVYNLNYYAPDRTTLKCYTAVPSELSICQSECVRPTSTPTPTVTPTPPPSTCTISSVSPAVAACGATTQVTYSGTVSSGAPAQDIRLYMEMGAQVPGGASSITSRWQNGADLVGYAVSEYIYHNIY